MQQKKKNTTTAMFQDLFGGQGHLMLHNTYSLQPSMSVPNLFGN